MLCSRCTRRLPFPGEPCSGEEFRNIMTQGVRTFTNCCIFLDIYLLRCIMIQAIVSGKGDEKHMHYHVHHCAHYMYGAATSMPANSGMYGYSGPPGIGLGPLEMTGIFLLAALAFGLLLWMTLPHQPAHEGAASAFLERPQGRRGEYIPPESSYEMWSSPPEMVQEISYEQPQADYPQMYYERPSRERYPEYPQE
jgi:hypothetical protein